MANDKNFKVKNGLDAAGDINLTGVTPQITFNGTSDATVDMAIKATPEGLDFYEPEDGNKIHFQILDDTGVNSPFGYKWNNQSLDARYLPTAAPTKLTNINTLGNESKIIPWHASTVGRPASSQSNEYGAGIQLAYDGSFASQIAHDFHEDNLYYRKLTLGTDSGTWNKVWSTSNDGAGSGLDADTLDGYNAEEGVVNNSIVKRDGTGAIKVGNILLDKDNAEINLKSGAGTTSGAINWTFNTTGTDYASIKLPYATRASTGLHIDSGYPITVDATTSMRFALAGSEKMRMDSSGNMLIGQTTASSGTVGTSLRQDGRNFFCADGNYSAHFNRKSSDGAIAHLAKDDTIIGTIGVANSNNLYIGGAVAGHGGIEFGTANTMPITVNDDLGATSRKWGDAHLSGNVNVGITGAHGAHIVLDTSQAGSPQISMSDYSGTGGDNYWALGADDADNNFSIHGSTTAIPAINNIVNPYFEITTAGVLKSAGNKIWHAGNDGSGSGLDADLLDGQEGAYYRQSVLPTALTSTDDLDTLSSNGWYKWGSVNPSNSPADYAILLNTTDGSQPQQLAQTYGGAANKVRLFGRRKTSGTWDTTWTEYWSNTNDGTGSGLDADKLDGVQGASFLLKSGGTMTGALTGTTATFRADTDALFIKSVTNQNAAEIAFSSQGPSTYAQIGRLSYQHGDTLAYGSGDAFMLTSTEPTTTVLADGKLMFKDGLYVKPSSGTGAGTLVISSGRAITATTVGVTNIVTNKVVKYNGSILDDSNITDTGSLITLGSATTVSGDLTIPNKLIHAGDTDTYLSLGTNTIALVSGGVNILNTTTSDINISRTLDLDPADNTYAINARVDVTDAGINATQRGFYLDMNVSGSTALTADRPYYGLHIDLDSVSTAGDTSNEGRLYGVYTSATNSGDADLVYGGYFLGQNSGTSAGTLTNTTTLVGVMGYADQNRAQLVATMYGVQGYCVVDNAGAAGTVNCTNSYAVHARHLQNTGGVGGTTTNAHGVYGEVEISEGVVTNAYGIRSHIDDNAGITTNAWLFYGSYAGTVGTKWGVYTSGATKNYLSGQIRTDGGTVALPAYSDNGDTNTGLYFPAADQVGISTGGGQRLLANSTGITVTGSIAVTGTVDGRDVAADGVLATNALPKAGGTMTGKLIIDGTEHGLLTVNKNDASGDGIVARFENDGVDESTVRFRNNGGGHLDLGIGSSNQFIIKAPHDNSVGGSYDFSFDGSTARVGGNLMWHAGNDASGSGLDADLLDGQHGSYYLPKTGGTMTGGINFNNYYETNTQTYGVTSTTPATLLWNGAALPNGGTYRFTAHIYGTGTDNSARCVVWNQNGTWKLNVTGQSGTNSNHPQFILLAGIPTLKTNHTSNYTIAVYGERMQLNEGTGTDNYNMFGADGFMSSVSNVLRYNPAGNGTTYSTGNTVWHAGNDGSGSGLDADTVQGHAPVLIYNSAGTLLN